MTVTQVAVAATCFYFGGLRGLVIGLWVNAIVVAAAAVWKERKGKR